MYLVTSEQMQWLDKQTINSLGISGMVLMEHAGREVARVVAAKRPQNVVVLCGKGNNGGDGWLAARWLKHWGYDVCVWSTLPPRHLTGDAKQAAQTALAAGVPVLVDTEGVMLPTADVYVDALLGTGGKRGVEGRLAALIDQLNAASPYTIAVDVPSGIDASTGEELGTAVQAAETVALAFAKLGTAVSPGCHFAGRVSVADIGIPMLPAVEAARIVHPGAHRGQWPDRNHEAHKGTFGRVGIIAGEMQGAAMLAAAGAARTGVGLVVVGWSQPATVSVPWDYVSRCVQPDVAATFADCTAVVIGPGLGCFAAAAAPIRSAFTGAGVIDADALAVLAAPSWPVDRADKWVLTPHPKECARLLGISTSEVQRRRLWAARQLAAQSGCTVVLKGYHAVITDASGRLEINPTGDASLAVGGTGDVLAGMIGSLLAQGMAPFAAAALASFLHGHAGELAGAELGASSVTATDVVESISRAIRAISTQSLDTAF